mgnify:CR=1 FL=1
MANTRIEQLIAQIDTTLTKPFNQALGGLSPVHYAKVSERRETLQKLRNQLATLNEQNQVVPPDILTACEQKVAKLRQDIEEPVTAWVKENKPRYDFAQTQPGETAIAESERMIEKIVERVTDKVYSKLTDLINNLDRHFSELKIATTEVATSTESKQDLEQQVQVLSQTKQNLEQQVQVLSQTKQNLEQQVQDLAQQVALNQDNYANSVSLIHQYLQTGLQEPLQAASTQVKQIQQAIASISVEPTFSQVSQESEIFLTEFVQRLQALFGKTLPTLAEQVKHLKDQVEFTNNAWQEQLEQIPQLFQAKLNQSLEHLPINSNSPAEPESDASGVQEMAKPVAKTMENIQKVESFWWGQSVSEDVSDHLPEAPDVSKTEPISLQENVQEFKISEIELASDQPEQTESALKLDIQDFVQDLPSPVATDTTDTTAQDNQASQTTSSDQNFLDWINQETASPNQVSDQVSSMSEHSADQEPEISLVESSRLDSQTSQNQAIADLEKLITTPESDSISQITQILDALELDLKDSNQTVDNELDFADLNLFADSQEEQFEDIIPPQPTAKNVAKNVTGQWSLGIDFNGEQILASLYNLTTNQQVEIPPIEAIAEAQDATNILGTTVSITHFKSILAWALPYLSKDMWQPQIQWQPDLRISLQAILSGFQDLLSQLEIPRSVRSHLQYVVFATPADWSDIYSLNLRQAALGAELVSQPEQVVVIDQAVAPLLTTSINHLAIAIDISWDNICLGLMGQNKETIGSNSYDYGGFGIIQDTLTQLLYSRWRNGKNLNRDGCNLEHVSFPNLATAEPLKRFLLHQELNRTEIGQQVWQAAVELIEQVLNTNQSEFHFQVADFSFSVPKRELENQVLQLFVQRVHRQLELLFREAGFNPGDIHQIFMIGKFADFAMLRHAFAQKFSQAEITVLEPDTTALGLAIAPKHFSQLNLCRQQYSDYFLLSELIGLPPHTIWTKATLFSTLQNQGVNVKACEARVWQIIAGQNQAQLFPWLELEHKVMFTDSALHRELAQGRLFDQIEADKFRPNTLQLQLLKAYFELVSGYLHQNLAEPLTLKLISV